jgi:hypothetical protein
MTGLNGLDISDERGGGSDSSQDQKLLHDVLLIRFS